MTFFLGEPGPRPEIKHAPQTGGVSSFGEGLSAGFKKAQIEGDASFRFSRDVNKEKSRIARQAANRLGLDKILEGGVFDEFNKRPTDIDQAFQREGFEISERTMKAAREAAIVDPEAWEDIDLTDEGIETKVIDQLKSELAETQETLDMMADNGGFVSVVGGMAGMLFDLKSLPFLVPGLGAGAGTLRQVAIREAGINAAAELAFIPSQIAQAKRLDIPAPSVTTQLALAGVAGGVLGVGMEAGARGIRFFNGRSQVRGNTTAYNNQQFGALTDRAEEVLEGDAVNPFQEIQDLVEAVPPKSENRINPDREPLIQVRPDEDAPRSALDDEIEADAARAKTEKDTRVTRAEEALDKAISEDRIGVKPLAMHLKNSSRNGGESLQIHPEGKLADELRSRGVTNKSLPGLFSKKGRTNFDNLVAADWEDSFPGIMDATGTHPNARHLNEDGFIDVLARDLEGDDSFLKSRVEVQKRDIDLNDALEGRTAQDDFLDGRASDDPSTLFIDPKKYEAEVGTEAAVESIRRDVFDWLETHPSRYDEILTRPEKEEIVDQLTRTGGDAEYLVERAIEREIEFGERALDGEIFNGSTAKSEIDAAQERFEAEGRGNPRQSVQDTGTTGRGDPNAADTRPATETVGVSQSDRFDAFSETTTPEARVIQDSVIDDLRTDVDEGGDFSFAMEEGGAVRSVTDILDEFKNDDEFLDVINLCGRNA